MGVFIFADINVHNIEAYEHYLAKVPRLIARHSGHYRVRGGNYSSLEGDWEPNRIILVQFPGLESAEAFYNNPDYQELMKIRHFNARPTCYSSKASDQFLCIQLLPYS